MISVHGVSKLFPPQRNKKHGRKESNIKGHDPRHGVKGFQALQDVSFTCERGKSMALLGPNGAGKTTLLRLLAGVLSPTDGQIKIDGQTLDAGNHPVRRRLGMLSSSNALYHRLTGLELLTYYGRLYNMSDKNIHSRIDFLSELLKLGNFAGQLIDTMSTGMKQRLAFARALIHDPDVLILDEPTTGMDIMSANIVVDFVRHCRETGKSILISTHNMSEVDYLCDETVVLRYGQVVFDNSIDALKAVTPSNRIEDALTQLVTKPGLVPVKTQEDNNNVSAPQYAYSIQ